MSENIAIFYIIGSIVKLFCGELLDKLGNWCITGFPHLIVARYSSDELSGNMNICTLKPSSSILFTMSSKLSAVRHFCASSSSCGNFSYTLCYVKGKRDEYVLKIVKKFIKIHKNLSVQ